MRVHTMNIGRVEHDMNQKRYGQLRPRNEI